MAVSAPTSDGWHELKRSSQADCPKVFYSISSGNDALNLLFTDLVGIWQCLMDKSDIVYAAREQRTSIDPSESNSQLQVFIQKLRQGLESTRNALYRDGSSEHLFLKTHVDLPRPLSPLNWVFKLSPRDAVELGEQLLRPCLLEASVSQKKLKSLSQVIKDKDHVISRLLEKLQASNTDLSLIFPGIRSRKGRVTVAEAERHVPGMATFDFKAWSSHFVDGNPYANYESRGIDCLVAGCQQCPKHNARQHSEWLRHLPIITDQTAMSVSPTPHPSMNNLPTEPAESADGDDATASEDDFQRQSTPLHLRKRSAPQRSEELSTASSTASEEDEIDLKQPRRLASRNKHSHSSHCGSSRMPKSEDVSEQHKISARAEPTASNTTSEDESLNATSEEDTKVENPSSSHKQPKEQSSSPALSSENGMPGVAKHPVRKLGKIGRKEPQLGDSKTDSIESLVNSPSKPSHHYNGGNKTSIQDVEESHNSGTKGSEPDDKSTTPAIPPVRRLGRLGRKNIHEEVVSSSANHNEPSGESKQVDNNSRDTTHQPTNFKSNQIHSPSPPQKSVVSSTLMSQDPSTGPKIKTEPATDEIDIPDKPSTEAGRAFTAEEKADQRREELKHRINNSAAGTRKKRKF